MEMLYFFIKFVAVWRDFEPRFLPKVVCAPILDGASAKICCFAVQNKAEQRPQSAAERKQAVVRMDHCLFWSQCS